MNQGGGLLVWHAAQFDVIVLFSSKKLMLN